MCVPHAGVLALVQGIRFPVEPCGRRQSESPSTSNSFGFGLAAENRVLIRAEHPALVGRATCGKVWPAEIPNSAPTG